MTQAAIRLALGAGCLVSLAASAGAGLKIDHRPLGCAVAESLVPVSAVVTPAADLASARVEFRAPHGTGWYVVGMSAAAGSLSAVLPRPSSRMQAFEYRIVAVDRAGAQSRTSEHLVPVATAESCPGAGPASGNGGASIVVSVPDGAPLVPPVPPGFNPAGTISSIEAAGDRPRRLGKLAAGVAVVGGVGGLATVFGSHAAESTGFGANTGLNPDTVPVEVALVGSDPPPGSTISLSRDRLTVVLRFVAERLAPLDNRTYRILFRGSGFLFTCVTMATRHASSGSTVEVPVDGPYEVSRACPAEFEVRRAQVAVIASNGQIVAQTGTPVTPDLVVDYRFVP